MNQHFDAELFNSIIDDLKSLTIAINYFDKFALEKDQNGKDIAVDSILLRSNDITNKIENNHQMTFPIMELKKLLSVKNYSGKDIHEILDFPIESLRKFILSEILRNSISE